MHRDRDHAARYLLIGALAAVLGATGCGGGSGEPAMEVAFARQELLAEASVLAIYFYDGAMTCDDVRPIFPRPTSLVGPYAAPLDDAGRQEGTTFKINEIPVGTYTVFIDAVDATGVRVGSGCAEMQTIHNLRVSRIRVTIS